VSASSHEFFDHTSEVGLRIRGPSFGDIIGEATCGLAELQLGRRPPARDGTWRRVAVASTDREALLVDWLNELIFRAETEQWVAVEVAVETAGDRAVTARVRGVSVAEAPARVKAVTHHGLSVRPGQGGLVAEVILDV